MTYSTAVHNMGAHPRSQKQDREIPIKKFYQTVIWDFKNKRKKKEESLHMNKLQISKERRKILVVRFIMGRASEISKVNHQIQTSEMS